MEIKQSGTPRQFDSGFIRDMDENKPRYNLMWPKGIKYEEQPLHRVAMLYAKGASSKVYGARNWEKANSKEEMDEFFESLERHLHKAKCGELDEDHMAAVIFNAVGIMYLQVRLGLLKDDTQPTLYAGSDMHDIFKLKFVEED